MAVREVLRVPHPDLKRRCAEAGGADVSGVVTDLLDTMAAGPRCVGVAAPQIAEMVRVCVVDCSSHPKAAGDNHGLLVLVDPEIVSFEGSEVGREGCLSIPELTADVRRATRVVVRSRDVEEFESVGFEARALQHEIDHLDGLLFLDRVASLSDDVFRRKRR